MTEISMELQQIINDKPCYVATVSKDGIPNVSVKGLIRVLDDHTLAFACVDSQKTLANLADNPHVAVAIAVPEKMKSYQLKGTAELICCGPLFDEMQEGLKRISADLKVKNVVKINVTEIYGA